MTGGLPATARSGNDPLFVVEADEYAGNFDAYRPDIAIVTSADWDHPDVFVDREAVIDTFRRWLEAMPAGGTIVANVGDAGVEAVLDRVTPQGHLTMAPYMLVTDVTDRSGTGRAGLAGSSRQTVIGRILTAEPSGTVLEIRGIDAAGGIIRVHSPLAGRHNAENALAVAAAARVLGVPIESIVTGLETFPGVGRRLERKGDARGVVVYDDYGHHPTAITATIEAVRQREPGRRVWAVYEPLTYHRTAALLPAFAEALATADAVAVADIWAGRDPDTTIASAAGLAREVTALRPTIAATAPGSVDETAEWLAKNVRSGDAVLVMGGGQSYKIGERLLDLLEAR